MSPHCAQWAGVALRRSSLEGHPGRWPSCQPQQDQTSNNWSTFRGCVAPSYSPRQTTAGEGARGSGEGQIFDPSSLSTFDGTVGQYEGVSRVLG